MVTKKEDDKQKQLQKQYLQLQLIDAQMQEIERELSAVEQKRAEIIALRDNIDSLRNVKNKGAFSEIGMGIYAESKIINGENLLVNVGANTFLKKNIADVKQVLKKQLEEFDKITDTLTKNVQLLSIQAQMVQAQMQKILGVG